MTSWKHRLLKIVSSAEQRLDDVKFDFMLEHDWLGAIQIQPYRGHGTALVLYLKGRVLKDKGIASAEETDSLWQNILNMYRRFNTDEIPGARLRVRFQDTEFETTTDEEGYFDLRIEPRGPFRIQRVWQPVELELLEPQVQGQPTVRAKGYVMVPPPRAEFGVISDVDDTIVRTGATDPLTMARIVVLNNPHTRLPFEGIAAFYQALRKGSDGARYNPIFYVSSSPWNLYDLLIDFLNIHGIPLGPLFLRDLGIEEDKFIKSEHHEHKLKQIGTILETHPELPFVLIGDSGQEDPEIYQQVVQQFPGRIHAIYIRDVTRVERGEAIRKIIKEIRAKDVEMLLVADTVTAAEHAAQRGFITPDALPNIQVDKTKDEQAPNVFEQLTRE